MKKYVIQLHNGVSSYYAGGDIQVSNRWTQSVQMATRWTTRNAATEFISSIRAILNPHGQMHVREIELTHIPDYSKGK